MKKTLIALSLLACGMAYAGQREHNCEPRVKPEPKSPPTKSEPPAKSPPEPRATGECRTLQCKAN